jgi:sn-glycerol 3-phosphate transport system substrate-binding protein
MSHQRLTARVGAIALGLVIALGATAPVAGAARGGSCPVHALDDARGKTTELVFWHVLTAENENVLQQQIAAFEQQHPDIHVKLVNQTAYRDLFDKYIAGLQTGDLPDIGQFEETTVQQLVDSQSTVTMADCVRADHYALKDFLPRAIAYYSTEGVLRAMPWTVSNPVVIYNKPAVVKAGIDPTKPPETLDQMRAYAQKIVDSGVAKHGMALHVEPFVNEFLYAKSGLLYVNNDNGRTARATKSLLDVPGGVKIWTWWRDMVESGLAVDTGATEGDVSHLFALGTGDAAMTFEASGALGPIDAVLASGQFAGTEIGVWPLPALRPGGGVPVGDGALWIPKASSPQKQAAAWELIKFLVSPEQQAALNVSSRGGYIPIRASSLDDPALKSLWDERPYLRVPFDQIEAGANNATASGSVIGAYQGVRDAVREGFVRMLAEGQSPKSALREAANKATEAIREYNDRIGG